MLADDRFTRERRFVDLQIDTLVERAVGRNLVARLDDHHIAHDHILASHFHHMSAAAHLHRLFFAQCSQHVEFAGSIHLKPEAHRGGQHNGKDDADGFHIFALDGCEPQRDERSQHQYSDDGVVVFFQIQFPQRSTFRRSQCVLAMFNSAFFHFMSLEPVGVAKLHVYFVTHNNIRCL